jgi:tRNA (Thr-GGU) A37 N-methylase
MPPREEFHFRAIGVIHSPYLEDMDIVDGTPLPDIKPYAPRFDVRELARSGWMEEVDEAMALQRGRRAGRSPDQF